VARMHLMLRNNRSIGPDPHQPRRVTTTLNKHQGSPFECASLIWPHLEG
jgi:hypothetical protein